MATDCSFEPRDFRSLDTQSSHQALLIESEGIDTAVHRLGAHSSSHTFIHDNQARGGTERPSVGLVHPVDRFLIHQEKRVAEFLDACLQPIRCRRRSVAAGHFAMKEERAFATLTTNDKPCLDDIRKDKDCKSVLRDFARGRILRDKLTKSGARLAGQAGGGCSGCGSSARATSDSPSAYFNFDIMLILDAGYFR